jgi:transcriptional regulator with XRE-family HTH domain
MPAKERFRAKEERERRRLAEAKSRDIAREFRSKKAFGAKEREKTKVCPSAAAESLSETIANRFRRKPEGKGDDSSLQEKLPKRESKSSKRYELPTNRTEMESSREGESEKSNQDSKREDSKSSSLRRSDEIYSLYFNEGLTQLEVAERLGISKSTISRAFRINGWTARHKPNRREIDGYEAHELYFDEGLTQKEVAEKLGVSKSTLSRAFQFFGWKTRIIKSRSELDDNKIRQLHFNNNLSQEEVAERLGVSRQTITRVFRDHEWQGRGHTKFESDEEREIANKEKAQLFRQKIHKLREKLFGTECTICGIDKEKKPLAIHRKDGIDHDYDALWRLGYLETVNPDEWAALCIPCHRGVHWLMKFGKFEWDEIEGFSKENRGLEHERKSPKFLEADSISTSGSEQVSRTPEENVANLRKALFGENCFGRPHGDRLLWSKKHLRALNPNDWVSLCQKCHRYVHWTMDELRLDWAKLESAFHKGQ